MCILGFYYIRWPVIEGPEEPHFATFFENQAEVKREHGKQFIRYLRVQSSFRPEIDNCGTGIQALESALELENQLTQPLLDVKTIASANNDTNILCFMEEQKSNTDYLQRQLVYLKELGNQAQEEEAPLKKPAVL
ncbi:hypothetical protein QTO34_003459, partial [Cnephaeus nilssonii]